MPMMLITKFILGATLVGNMTLLSLFLRERRTTVQSVFSIYLIAVTAWTVFIMLNLWLQSLFVERLIFASATVFLVSQVWFVILYPDGKLPDAWWRYWSVAVGAFFLLASFLPGAIFTSISVHRDGYTLIENGPLMAWYSFFATAYVAAPVVILVRRWRRERAQPLRAQYGFLAIGFSAFLAVNILTNMLLPVFFRIYFFNAIGPVFSLALAASVLYIVSKHRFLGISLIIERGFAYSSVLILLVAAYFGSLLLTDIAVGPQFAPLASGVILTVIGIAVIYGIERHFQGKRLLDQERAYAASLEQKVAERTQHLELLQKQHKQMLGDIAHALQTPLTVLKGTIELMERELGREHHRSLEATRKSTDAVSAFIRDLLRLSRLDTMPSQSQAIFEMSSTVRDVVEYVGTICVASDIRLSSAIEDGVRMHGTQKDIEELLTILLSNAVRYMKNASRRHISVALRRESYTIILEVADTGIGIPAQKLPHIFERFYRAHDEQESGHGLGLAIAQSIARNHGATISVASIEGSGATFTVRFSSRPI